MSSKCGGRAVPVAIGEPDPALVEKVRRKHQLPEGKRRKDGSADVSFLGDLSHLRGRQAAGCACVDRVLTLPRSTTACAAELLEEDGEGAQGSRQRRDTVQRGSEVLSVMVEVRRYEMKKRKGDLLSEDMSRIYRYYAYRSFVAWAYSHLRLGNRY
ncbi:hypothetical protein GCK32_010189 [Trichostrongylus colubriformis]|uniref:Uncharacterized protein n=1 Tax=Trichostrongylus colubriformis TaxID=6319 RepID=A0AAN8FE40_TRICO